MTEEEAQNLGRLLSERDGVAVFIGISIVSALAEARTVDPLRVIDIAEYYGNNSDVVPDGVKPALKLFATLLRDLATPPDARKP